MAHHSHYTPPITTNSPAVPAPGSGPPQFDSAACGCRCGCAGCYCSNTRAERREEQDDGQSEYVIVDFGRYSDGSSEDGGFPEGSEGPEGHPAAARFDRESPFPWRGNGGRVDTHYGGFERSRDGFKHAEGEELEPLRRSVILRDLSVLDRTGTPSSLANEATSGEASVTSSGFLPRRSNTPHSLSAYSHIGAWDETAPSPACFFPARSQRVGEYVSWNDGSGYPEGISDEDME